MKITIAICLLVGSVIGGAIAAPMTCESSKCDRTHGGWICPIEACR